MIHNRLTMSGVSKRIKELVDEFTEGNVLKFATNVGTSDTVIRNYITLGRKPNAEILISISQKYNVNIQWILTGVGNKYLSEPSEVSETTAYSMDANELKKEVKLLKEVRDLHEEKIERLEITIERLNELLNKRKAQ